jgi:hypothetical protein
MWRTDRRSWRGCWPRLWATARHSQTASRPTVNQRKPPPCAGCSPPRASALRWLLPRAPACTDPMLPQLRGARPSAPNNAVNSRRCGPPLSANLSVYGPCRPICARTNARMSGRRGNGRMVLCVPYGRENKVHALARRVCLDLTAPGAVPTESSRLPHLLSLVRPAAQARQLLQDRPTEDTHAGPRTRDRGALLISGAMLHQAPSRAAARAGGHRAASRCPPRVGAGGRTRPRTAAGGPTFAGTEPCASAAASTGAPPSQHVGRCAGVQRGPAAAHEQKHGR